MEPLASPMEIVIEPADAGKRLDKALAERLTDFSRARLQGLIAEGHVRLGEAVETNAARKLRGDERIVIDLPPPEPAVPQGEAIPLQIAYEDADLIVINKPAGMVVHPSNGHETGTLVHALIAHCGAYAPLSQLASQTCEGCGEPLGFSLALPDDEEWDAVDEAAERDWRGR